MKASYILTVDGLDRKANMKQLASSIMSDLPRNSTLTLQWVLVTEEERLEEVRESENDRSGPDRQAE